MSLEYNDSPVEDDCTTTEEQEDSMDSQPSTPPVLSPEEELRAEIFDLERLVREKKKELRVLLTPPKLLSNCRQQAKNVEKFFNK